MGEKTFTGVCVGGSWSGRAIKSDEPMFRAPKCLSLPLLKKDFKTPSDFTEEICDDIYVHRVSNEFGFWLLNGEKLDFKP